jgi:hypothetical protein
MVAIAIPADTYTTPDLGYSKYNYEITLVEESQRIEKDALPRSSSHVSFDEVSILEFELELGDNPFCSSGPPLTLAWSPFRKYKISLDTFESIREVSSSRSGDNKNLLLSRLDREQILRNKGYSRKDINNATYDSYRHQKRITKSVKKYQRIRQRKQLLNAAHRVIVKTVSILIDR